tara:strand:- start:457 stop:1383 length:927 start_codon:yes stop_codon:yes gene_type:complete
MQQETKLDVGDAEEEAVEVELKEKPQEQLDLVPKEEAKEEPKEEVKEEKKEEELEEYSTGVKNRIDKLTKRMREEERQKTAATQYANSVKTENDQLKLRLNNLDQGYQEEFGGRIDSQLTSAKRAFKDAHEAGDVDRMVDAQEALANLTVEKGKLKKPIAANAGTEVAAQTGPAPGTAPPVQAPGTPQPAAPPDPRAEAWAARNVWFGQDEVMTYASFGIHRRLIEDEGFDPQTEDYYGELDKRMAAEFPHKLGRQAGNGGSRKVASAESSRSRNKGGRKSVRLTPSQVAIAKKLGVPLEEYAKYVKE